MKKDMFKITKKEQVSQLYEEMINNKIAPQIARGILPLDLATEIVISANLREWRHILKMRTAPDAHPQIREIMEKLLIELKKQISIIFDDI